MKIAIIGAGINGLYLAWKLAERGEEVIVFEKRDKIGKEVCSGLFSERILEFVPPGQELIQNQINSVFIHFPRRTFKVKFSRRFLVINHSELDNLVAKLAKRAGVKIILNENVKKQDLVTSFDKVVGCDGANSVVRKWLNLPEPKFRLGIQGFVSRGDASNYVETWPVKDGFIWKIPRGLKTEYGIIAGAREAKKVFEDFLAKNKIFLEKISSALVPQGFLIPKHSSITLGGDAAGLAKPWSGGGVIWGLIAADLLLRNFPDFLKYQKETKKFFLPKIIFSRVAVKTVYFFGFNIPWLMPRNVKIESDFLI